MKTSRLLAHGIMAGGLASLASISAQGASFDDVLAYEDGKINDWFHYSDEKVLGPYPARHSGFEEQDRVAFNRYSQQQGTRKALSERDANLSSDYRNATFAPAAFGNEASKIDVRHSDAYQHIRAINDRTNSYIAENGEMRFTNSYFKDKWDRARPYNAIDPDTGEWLPSYPTPPADESSHAYPSGHTAIGFAEAVPLALAFPERGEEIYSRALQYGESRVVLGVHYPTDTIGSRALANYTTTQLLSDPTLKDYLVTQARQLRQDVAAHINGDLRQTLAQQPTLLADHYRADGNNIGYYGEAGKQATPGLAPDKLPNNAGNLLLLRFPYLSREERRNILASTSYPEDSLAGYMTKENNPDSYWGLLDVPNAYRGPARFYRDTTVNQRVTEDDIADFGIYDEWKNNISGPGRLIKQGTGALTLSGNNSFAGITLEEGTLALEGANALTQTSRVNGGTLIVNGTLDQGLTVEGGRLQGHGTLKGDTRITHGTLAPGGSGSVGALTIDGDLHLANSSTYAAKIDAQREESDTVNVSGTTSLEGGQLKVVDGDGGELSPDALKAAYGKQYTLLTSNKGIEGSFGKVNAGTLPFAGGTLNYTDNEAIVTLGRNGRRFAEAAHTSNQRAVADVLETLPTEGTLYRNFVFSPSDGDAQRSLEQLSGQLYSDILEATLVADRQVSSAIINHLSRSTARDGVWFQLVGNNNHVSGKNGIEGYHNNTKGLQLGAEKQLPDNTTLGAAFAYLDGNLHAGEHGKADSDNYYLDLYANHRWEDLSISFGGGYAWHHIDTKRSVDVGDLHQHLDDSNHGHSWRLFGEARYDIQAGPVTTTPYLNLSYNRFQSGKVNEGNGSAALNGAERAVTDTTSTAGVRFAYALGTPQTLPVTLQADLGWLHQWASRDRDRWLHFNDSTSDFRSRSVDAFNNAAAVSAGAMFGHADGMNLSVDYVGSFGGKQHNNGINAQLSWAL
ncbi:autotransporter domain-containing protein [Carnimonas nigrificans]|uniref:autotransporter domain-containing protein n=1 Tax=Carnimonas nigrificans TaxID=64323 RepID=UPI00047286C6|nr:autotransporter domain-containing protein [Carnimonas nigrificans]